MGKREKNGRIKRHSKVSTLITVLGIVGLIGAISSTYTHARTLSASEKLEARVLKARAMMDGKTRSSAEDPSNLVAQWPNWPNWPNWGNWPNWFNR